MAKVAIAPAGEIRLTELPEGFSGPVKAQSLFGGDKDLFRVLVHHIERGAVLRIAPKDMDCQAFLWRGEVVGGGWELEQGSSLIVEHGASLRVRGSADTSLLVTFQANRPPNTRRSGGHVHLLPSDRVPRIPNMHKVTGIRGALHADSACATCELWLHENHFPAVGLDPNHITDTGIHSHSEDEVIFVTEGRMRLGQRMYDPGTAVAIASDTFYSFTAGPEGVGFVNFRPVLPREVRFPDGRVMDETQSWQIQLEKNLEYVDPR